MAAVAAMAVYMQAVAGIRADPSPDPAVLLGALQIGLLQHATLLGFALAAFIAGRTLGDDLQNGAFESWRLTDPSRAGRWVRMIAAVSILLLLSALVTAVTLFVWAHLDGTGPADPSSPEINLVQSLTALVVIVSLSCLSVAAATVIRNGVLLAMAAVVLFTFPMQLSVKATRWLFPSRWIAEGLYLDERGFSVDYLNERSLEISAGPTRWLGLVVLVLVSTAASSAAAHYAEGRRGGT